MRQYKRCFRALQFKNRSGKTIPKFLDFLGVSEDCHIRRVFLVRPSRIDLFAFLIYPFFLAAINSLLESISEKDESVRNAIELALGRMAERRPNETMMALCDFKAKQQKLPEQQTAIVLRYFSLIFRIFLKY